MPEDKTISSNSSVADIFFSKRKEVGDKEAAILSFASSMKNFGISETETRQFVTEEFPGIIDLVISGLTSKLD